MRLSKRDKALTKIEIPVVHSIYFRGKRYKYSDYLKIKGAKNIWGYDPIVPSKEISDLGVECSSLDEGFEDASVVFIMNNHRSYFDMNIYQLLEKMSKPAVFYDGWNLFPAQDIQNVPGIIYSAVGVG